MSTPHTPGPWRVDDHGFKKENGDVLDRAGEQVCRHCTRPTGHPAPAVIQILAKRWGVAQLQSMQPKDEYAQMLADARLIAAAPELLEACRNVRDSLRGLLPGQGVESLHNEVNWLNAAIAKAEGDH